jgi:hypothetical protein
LCNLHFPDDLDELRVLERVNCNIPEFFLPYASVILPIRHTTGAKNAVVPRQPGNGKRNLQAECWDHDFLLPGGLWDLTAQRTDFQRTEILTRKQSEIAS